MSLHRRQLAVALAGAALVSGVVYGLHEMALGGEEPTEPAKAAVDEKTPPTWFQDALAEMKATKTLGVAIVLPAGKDARETLRASLQELLDKCGVAAQVHLLEAVYVLVDGRHVGAQKGETAVLLDAEGKRIAGASVVFTPEKFAETIRPLLRDGDRLAERAKAARTKEIEQAFADIEGKDAARIAPAVGLVSASFSPAAPAVIEAYEKARPESRLHGNLAMVLAQAFRNRRDGSEATGGRALAFGARWQAGKYEWDCPPCGRMAMPVHGNVLEFLTRDAGAPK